MTHTMTGRRGFLGALAAGALSHPALARIEALDAELRRAGERVRGGAATTAGRAALAGEYMLEDGLLYLNHASIGTVPRPVHDAHVGYLELCESHPHVYVWEDVWRDAMEETRRAAAALLRCDPEDLAITHNTTEGFNVLAHGLALGEGDEVLFSTLNHSSASGPWEGLAARRGFEVRRFPFPVGRAAELSAEEVVALHAEAIGPRTRVLVVPHIDNLIGLRLPIDRVARAARDRGVRWVFVDGAQSAGMIPLDLGASGVDAYAMSPHKWIQSPKGLGLFFTTPEVRAAVPRMWMKGSSAAAGARAYEDYSTRAWPAVVALGDALAFQSALGESAKEAGYRALHARFQAGVDAEPGLTWCSPRDWEDGSMLLSVRVRGRRASEVGPLLLSAHRMGVRAFGGSLDALRISPNLTITDDQVDHTVALLASMSS